MSLGKLLSTGRSLIGGAPNEGRYDISNCNKLPKFNAAKNPFAQPSKPAELAPVTPVPAPVVAPVEPSTVEPVPVMTAPVVVTQPKKTQVIEYKKTQRLPQVAGPSYVQATLVKSKAMAQAGMAFCLASFVKGLGVARKVSARFHHKEPATVLPRLGKPAVQTLLSLDNVTVVRNSLEDSDLEIVTASTATSTQVAPTTPVASPKRGPVPAALKKLSARLMSLKAQD